MGTLSMPASDLHTKYHRPPDRSSDLLGGRHGAESTFLKFKRTPWVTTEQCRIELRPGR
jgi:hypothetical protein